VSWCPTLCPYRPLFRSVMLLPMALSVLGLVESRSRVGANSGAALLLGLAYAASIGGMGTLIGTPPNALLAGFMDEAYGVRIGFRSEEHTSELQSREKLV